MANETNKVVIITTKHYPIADDWDNGGTMDIDRLGLFAGNDGLLGLVSRLELYGDATEQFTNNPCVKTKRFENNAWVTCVVPCMKNNDSLTAQLKGQYIEYILELCSEGTDAQNVYLVAHEKDFVNFAGVKGELVKERHIPTPNCVRVKELVKMGHAYMFQHDEGNDVGKYVIPKLENNFDKEDFKRLLHIVDAEWEMNDFFTMVNTDSANEYLFQNNTTPTP